MTQKDTWADPGCSEENVCAGNVLFNIQSARCVKNVIGSANNEWTYEAKENKACVAYRFDPTQKAKTMRIRVGTSVMVFDNFAKQSGC